MGPEARIACPQCGGLIHPVAGRCKHCKADLAAVRGGKPQSASTLPSLGNRSANDRPIAGPPMPARLRGNVAMPSVDPLTAELSMGSPLPSANQVLPPRHTGQMLTTVQPPAAWPLIVIALSVLAILLSIGAIAS
ncbi:MAG: hypothetical protein H0V17_28825 [Deltaproteobacteria bacterium]|nr:hypothetical protein [Deltaproteobacteria bacterium]